MRSILSLFLLIVVALLPLTADASSSQARAHGPTVPESTPLVNTIDELAAMFNSEQCGECHEEIYEQW